jgi:hypothetical protein
LNHIKDSLFLRTMHHANNFPWDNVFLLFHSSLMLAGGVSLKKRRYWLVLPHHSANRSSRSIIIVLLYATTTQLQATASSLDVANNNGVTIIGAGEIYAAEKYPLTFHRHQRSVIPSTCAIVPKLGYIPVCMSLPC